MQEGEADYSTTFSSGRVHRSTHFHALYSAFASVVGLLCIAVIILISVWRFHRQRTLLGDISRRHGGRRLVSTYPQMQASGSRHTTQATVVLPPPYCEALSAPPPPYSTVDRNELVPANPQSNAGSGEFESLQQSLHKSDPSDGLLNQTV